MRACAICDLIGTLLYDNGRDPEVKARSAVTLAFLKGLAVGLGGKGAIPPTCASCMELMDVRIVKALADQAKVQG